jgi:hypothetical protein
MVRAAITAVGDRRLTDFQNGPDFRPVFYCG